MLNRSLFFSVAAVLFLLILQGLWLYRIIDNEQKELKSKVITIVEESTKKELDSRIQSLMKRGGKSINISLKQSTVNNTNFDSINKIDSRDVSTHKTKKNVSNISMEEALQEMIKKDFPPQIDTLNRLFGSLLEEKGIFTNYKLQLFINDTENSVEESNYKAIPIIKPYFQTEYPITISKDIVVRATVYFPISMIKGDLLSILAISLALTIFILFIIFTQIRMIYKQVSMAKLKENVTHFFTHELRSPLQSSLTNLEVAELMDGDSSKLFLQKSKEQLYFLNKLIENILSLNKFEKKHTLINREKFNIIEAIEPHIERYKLNTEKSISIDYIPNPEIETINADKLHIFNAIGNLVDNAVKYSGESVKIVICVDTYKSHIRISVKDNGFGIPKNEQSKIFEKFYRVKRADHSKTGRGFGLGLNYVKWVVKAHNGAIQLESEPGLGSNFSLLIKNR